MPVYQGLTAKNVITQVRTDLADTDSSNYRWSDATITRQIDRALDKYSFYSPNQQAVQIPTIQASRLYGTPIPAWWVDQVEYPIGSWPKVYVQFSERISPLIAAPTLAPTTVAAAGALTGSYKWVVTYTVPGGGESLPSPVSTPLVLSGQGAVVTLPIGPYGVSGRNLYRTQTNGTSLYLAVKIAENTSTSYLDTIADGALPGVATPNIKAPTTDSTSGIAQFEMQLSAGKLPADATGTIEVTVSYKHELDAYGTTVPERHWDAIALGTEAFCLEAYLPVVNDNFEYVDGQFRDKVDDTKSTAAWRAQARDFMEMFNHRLRQIRTEEFYNDTQPNPTWGDRPVRWERL